MTVDEPEASSGGPTPEGADPAAGGAGCRRECPCRTRRWILVAVSVAAPLVALALWLPGIVFAFNFQARLTGPEAAGIAPILRARLESGPGSGEAGPARATAGESPASDVHQADWSSYAFDGVRIPLPPGEVIAQRTQNGAMAFTIDGATLVAEKLPAGTIAGLYAEELSRIGAAPDGTQAPGDLECLLRAAATSTDDFRFTFGAGERSRYAAAILTKVLLFSGPDRAGSGEFRLRRVQGARAAGVIATFPGGGQAIIVAPGGTIVYRMRECPDAWAREPWRWGEIGK